MTDSSAIDGGDPFHNTWEPRNENFTTFIAELFPDGYDGGHERLTDWQRTGNFSSPAALTSASALPALRDQLLTYPFEAVMSIAVTGAAQFSANTGTAHVPTESTTLALWTIRTLKDAELVWVDTDAAKAAFNAVDQLESSITLHDLPALTTNFRSTFAVFATPFQGIDYMTGEPSLLVDALLWGPGRIHDADNGNDATSLGMSVLSFRCLIPERSDLTAAEQERIGDPNDPFNGWFCLGSPSNWLSNKRIDEPTTRTVSADQNASHSEDRRLLAAMLSILDTPRVFHQTTTTLPRQQRRNLERHADKTGNEFNPDRYRTNVITLGVPPAPSSGGTPADTEFESTRRGHTVRSHTRLQPHGPGRTLRRSIVVPAHWRGNMDDPVNTDTVYRVIGDQTQ